MCIALPRWAKNVFVPYEKILSSPALKGTGVLSILLIRSSCGGKQTTLEPLLFLTVRQGNPLQALIHILCFWTN